RVPRRGTRARLAAREPAPDSLIPGIAVVEPAAARAAGLGAQRPAPAERVVELEEVGRDRAESLLVAHVEALGQALADREHAVGELARAAQGELVQAEAARDAPVERHRLAAGEERARGRLQ